MTDPVIAVALIGLTGVLATALFSRDKGRTKAIEDVCTRVTKLETQMSPFWDFFKGQLADMLHSADKLPKDILLDNHKGGVSTLEEMKILRTMLNEEIAHDPKGELAMAKTLEVLYLNGLINWEHRQLSIQSMEKRKWYSFWTLSA